MSAVQHIVQRGLAESALGAPAAGFGDHEEYPQFEVKCAVLLQRIASNHALPDGNKRTALLCAILFANLNGFMWIPPAGDDEDGQETAEVVEAAAAWHVPLPALAAWVRDRLHEVPNAPPPTRLVQFPAEYIGALPYDDDTIEVGGLIVRDVHGQPGLRLRTADQRKDGGHLHRRDHHLGGRLTASLRKSWKSRTPRQSATHWASRSTGANGWLASTPTVPTGTP